jgi:hypothetical protein
MFAGRSLEQDVVADVRIKGRIEINQVDALVAYTNWVLRKAAPGFDNTISCAIISGEGGARTEWWNYLRRKSSVDCESNARLCSGLDPCGAWATGVKPFVMLPRGDGTAIGIGMTACDPGCVKTQKLEA